MNCPYCMSTHINAKGYGMNQSGRYRRYKCMTCSKNFTQPFEENDMGQASSQYDAVTESYVRDSEWVTKKTKGKKKFVITSAQSNSTTNQKFLKSLEIYCEKNNAVLFVIPVKYRNPSTFTDDGEYHWCSTLYDHLIENNFKLHDKLKVLGAVKINATAANPLTGLDPISKGDSVVVGHNQLQMKTLAVNQDDNPVIMTTTGTVSDRDYSISKQGYKAKFNHSFSAVLVELDDKIDAYHIRHLNFDGKGFFDLDKYYSPDGIKANKEGIRALVTGDEHALFNDPEVKTMTYLAKDSITKFLKPKYIVRHDLLDCYSISHHHRNSVFTKYAKYASGTNKIEDELNKTIEFVKETSPKDAINLVVPSNHNDHLTRWLNEADPKYEPWNAVLYHKLMYKMLERTSMEANGVSHPNPFELYCGDDFTKSGFKVEFLKRNVSFKIEDVEIGMHGDVGQNGARGSRTQLSNLPSKTIIGHSHSPGIEKGCYQVGTSSYLKMEYTTGPSSWLHTHCIIYPNGKRQLLNIINGRWKA